MVRKFLFQSRKFSLFLRFVLFFLGNLALSRALGDFIFKRNTEKRPEEQVVTGKNSSMIFLSQSVRCFV